MKLQLSNKTTMQISQRALHHLLQQQQNFYYIAPATATMTVTFQPVDTHTSATNWNFSCAVL